MRFRLAASLVLVSTWGVLATAQVKLERKVAEDATTRVKGESKIHQVMGIQGMNIETDVDAGSNSTVVVGKRKADGTIAIEVTLDTIWAKLQLPGGIDINVNTDDKEMKVDLPQLSFMVDLLKALKGSSYTVVLDSKNQFARVEGTEKNLAKLSELPKPAADGVKARFNSDRIKHEFEQVYGAIPDGFVREAEPWDRTEESDIGAGQTLTFKRKFEYKGTVKQGDKTLDKIDIKTLGVVYKQEPTDASPAKVTKSDLKIDSSEGTLLFDRERGVIVERNDKTRMKGDMTLVVNGMELPVTLDLTMEAKYLSDSKPKS